MLNRLLELTKKYELINYAKPRINWNPIAEIMNKEFNIYHKKEYYKLLWQRYKKGIDKVNIPKAKNTFEIKPNGDRVYTDITIFDQEEDVTPKMIMKLHKLDNSKWKVISFIPNVWQSATNDGIKNLCQSKLTVKPIVEDGITIEIIDDYFENKKFNKKPIPLNYKYNTDGEILEICYTDAHNGLLSWREESGADYDLKIASDRFRFCIEDVIARCKGKKIKKILFATLGDIIHTDNDQQTTTKGTLQQVDGRMAKIFNIATDMMIESLDRLLEIAPIEYVYLSGNHDRITGYCLAKSLALAYRFDGRITFDVLPNPQKYRMIGKDTYLIGLCHGDMSKKNLAEWLQKIIRTKIGIVKYASVHCGHKHEFSIYEKDGIVIKHLPALCENSLWEHESGYSSDKALMCFVYDDNIGLRETWITNI